MCCLFGLIDVKHQLSGSEKNRIFSILAEASEAGAQMQPALPATLAENSLLKNILFLPTG